MMKKTIMLVKFGERKHLEMFCNGTIYFSPIQKYREDTTKYRGDNYEGLIPIDPTTLKITNNEGKDLFTDLGIPHPISVTQQMQGDENLFMFCAAKINNDNLEMATSGGYIFSEAFKKSISQFGEYGVVFLMHELLDKIKRVKRDATPPFGLIYDSICYRDLNDFSDIDEIKHAYYGHKSVYDRYFVKDLKYKNQNEWRLIIDGYTEILEANCGEGYCIQAEKFSWANICDTITLLDTFKANFDNHE